MFPNLGGVSHQVGKLVPSLLSLGETLASWTEDAVHNAWNVRD